MVLAYFESKSPMFSKGFNPSLAGNATQQVVKHELLGMHLIERSTAARRRAQGFSLMEVLVAVLVLTTISTAFYLGLSSCFSVVKASREDVRATQIMMQKLEAVRLCTWSELSKFTFKEPYDPVGSTNNTSGMYYFGSVSNSPATTIPGTASYLNNMCLVTVNLVWTNFNNSTPIVHTREMQTHYARYGLQSYIWGAIQ
jgi:prepilin-type N-terminal cleavage/methylation domain-containing protein